MRLIRKAFQIVSPKSAKEGNYEETGWEDEKGAEIAPDEYDIEEHESELAAVIALTVKHINECVEASSYPGFQPGVWYTTVDPHVDYTSGHETTYSYHLDGFSIEEQEAIYKELTDK